MKKTILLLAHLLARRAWLWTGFLAFATIAFGPQPAKAAVAEAWVQRYGSEVGSADYAYKVVTDTAGNVIVAGFARTQSDGVSDMVIIKYSGAGVPLWTNRYNGLASEAITVAVSASGNVFVTGGSFGSGGNSDYATIAYSGAGVPLWTNRYNAGYGPDQATAVAVDCSGNVFVTGSSATIAYSGAGVPLWTNGGSGTAIALDASGNVFVTGGGFTTIAYSGAGVPLWINGYNGPGNGYDYASALAVDGSGNVFVTGSSQGSGFDRDYATIKYSGVGVPLWTNRYNGPYNGNDEATAVAVDASGNVFVTGSSATIAYSGAGVPLWTNGGSGTAIALDASGNVFVTGGAFTTIAYSGAGAVLWTNRYGGGGRDAWDIANAVAVDASGNVFVTGYSYGIPGYEDYATIAYSGAGVALWTNRYNGPGNGSDSAYAVAVDGSGNVFVTGESGGDYATIKYSGAGVPLWIKRYNGPGNSYDYANAVAVDGSGNVFVTGSSATIAYSGAGVPLWTNRYIGPGNGGPDLAIGSDGAVYVAGTSDGDFVTVKYVWRPEIAIQLLSTIPPKVNLTLSAAPNSSWAIERARELTGPWTHLSALLIGTNGSAQFQDTNSPSPAGFYRARQ